MTEIKIQFEGEEHPRLLEVKNPKGRDINKYWDWMTKVGKSSEDESMDLVDKFREWLDEKAAELSGISVEELNDLDIDEKEKLMNNFVSRAKNAMGFMKP